MLCNGKIARGKQEACTKDGESGCRTSSQFLSASASALLPANIKTGVSLGGVTGSFSGNFSTCTSDGQTSCITSAGFPAADSSQLLAANIKHGVQVGGVTGQKRDTKLCRNGAHLATWDSSGISNLGSGPDMASINQATGGSVDSATDELNFDATFWGLSTAYPVKLSSSGTMPTGITAGATYYVVISGSKIKLATSVANANAGTPVVNITAANTGTLYLQSVPDGVVSLWDTIDDYNNNLSVAPTSSPWSSDDVCDSTNFTDISAAGNPDLTPPNTTPAGATAAFSQIWRDDLTGLLFTNILVNLSDPVSWFEAMGMCAGLNSGDGTGQWRLGTQKELMQLYVNGISKLTVNGGTWLTRQGFWTLSAWSEDTIYAWYFTLGDGYSYWGHRADYSYHGVVCVR